MKKLELLLFPLFLFLLSTTTQAQIIGGQKNGQSLPTEVKPSEITAGGFSGNVNLFAGTYNASYPLGTVSTPTGLSFSANLNYSSTFTSGDNLPHLSGVPYGEGWSLEIPSISVSSEDYNKYTLWEKYRLQQGHEVPPNSGFYTPLYTVDEAFDEGNTYWFSPMLNIPGVASGRMVYKYYRENKYYFVLHVFERYVEATFNGGTWEVTLDDGTVYHMIPAVLTYRTPSNQRVNKSNYAHTDDVCDDVEGGKALPNLTLPKEEVISWYCQKITNKNLVGAIHFKYETFGGFDYNKVFNEQNELWELISDEWLSTNGLLKPDYSKTYKDIILREIDSGYERLLLDYESISTTGGNNLLDVNDEDNVTRLDSMYSSVVVYEASNEAGFTDWLRYKHVRRDEMGSNDVSWNPSPRNPYKNNNGKYFRETLFNNQASFNHGYLESPRLNGLNDYVSGDIYEIQTKIGGCLPYTDPATGAFFDINIATGNHTGISIGYGDGPLDGTDYEKVTREQVFSTFNQAIKWHTRGNGDNPPLDGTGILTSNFFVMPNLPDAYEGFQIQVGPANSDNNFGMEPEDILAPNGTLPQVCKSYFGYLTGENCDTENSGDCQGYLRSGDNIPNNFGIGLPWRMLTEFYSQWSSSYCFCPPNGNPGKWWNYVSAPTAPFPNVPTVVDADLELDEVKLIRYSKNPYMLKTATKQINNESSFDPNNNSSVWHTTGINKFEYAMDVVPRYGAYVDAADQVHYEPEGMRNVVLLNRVTQEPYLAGAGTAEPLVTDFHYRMLDNQVIGLQLLDIPNYTPTGTQDAPLVFTNILSHYHVMESIEDPLGKTTDISYKAIGEGSYFIRNFVQRQRPGEIQGLPGGNTVKQAPQHAYQVFMVVDKLVTSEREGLGGTKSWRYSFGPMIPLWGSQVPAGLYDDRPFFNEHFVYDWQFGYKAGYPDATVTGPCQGSDCAGVNEPVTVYRHHTDDKKWGKLFYVESKDEEGNILSTSQTDYEAIPAFESPAHRVFMDDPEQWDYKEYWNVGRPQFNGNFADYNDDIWDVVDINALSAMEIYLGYQTENPRPVWQYAGQIDCNDFENLEQWEQEACEAYWNEVTIWQLNRPQGWITPYRQGNSPNLFYEFTYARLIEEHDPTYLYSFFLKKTGETTTTYDKSCTGGGSASMTTSTSYEYFDAQFDGTSTSSGWEKINAEPDILIREPSWQLYKKTTTSQDYTNTEEYFYFWDLTNDGDFTYVSSGTMYPKQGEYNLLWLLYTYRKQRTLLYEKRVTNTTPGGPNTRSTSYVYSAEWEPENGDGEVINIADPDDPDPCPGQPGSGNTGTEDPGNPPCFTYKGNEPGDEPCYGNCGAYCEVQHEPPFHLYCTPCGIMPPPTNNFGGSGSGTNYYNYSPSQEVQEYINNRLQGKIYLKKVVEQVGPSCGGLFTDNTPGFEHPGFNCDSLTTYEVLSRNPLGMVVEEMDEKYLHTRYTYGQGYNLVYLDCSYNPPALRSVYLADFPGLPTEATVGYGRQDALTSKFDYNVEDNTVKAITDPNEMELEYLYDGFGRMAEARRNGELIQKVEYKNANQDGGSFTASTMLNYVKAFNYVEGQSGWGTQGYIDPLGRKVGTVNYSGVHVLVEDNIYDLYNRPVQKLKRQLSSDPIVNQNMDPINLNFKLDIAPRERAVESAKYGRDLGDGHTVKMDYCFKDANNVISEIAAAGQTNAAGYITGAMYLRTEAVDEDGKTVVSFTDGGGNTAATISNNGTVATLFKYGPFGKAVSVVNANNQTMSYTYNFVGQLTVKVTPDDGTNRYAYNQSGQLICQQDNKGEVRVYDYDAYGRIKIQAKEGSNDHHTMLDTQYDGMPWRPSPRRDYAFLYDAIANSKKEKEWYYHTYYPNYTIDQEIITDYVFGGGPKHIKGRLCETVSYDTGDHPIEIKFLAYNENGFLKHEVSQFGSEGLGQGEQIAVAIKYPEYNLQGSYKVQNVDILHKGSDVDYQHFYVYDSWNRIRKVYANFNNQKNNGFLVAEYEYDDVLGVVKKKKLFNNDKVHGCKNIQVDAVTFEFDVRERLNLIHSTLYDHTLTYDDVVLNNSDINYNGNINSTTAAYSFYSPQVVNVPDNFHAPTIYGYEYDNLNRLMEGHATTSIFDPNNPIKYSGPPSVLGNVSYTYDKVGNILTQDYGTGFKVTPDSIMFGEAHHIYNYASGNNRLMGLTSWGNISVKCHDPVMTYSSEFGYDPNGNMTSNTIQGLVGVDYGRSNLPFSIGMVPYGCTDLPNAATYFNLYDASDARIWKSGEYYQRDGAGHELFVYNFYTDEYTWYVYGNERVAKLGKKSVPDDGNGGPGDCKTMPSCDGASSAAQQQFLQNLTYITNPNSLDYPTKLFRIRLCDGTDRYLLQAELSGIPGNYAIVQQIDVVEPTQFFTHWTIMGLQKVGLNQVLYDRIGNDQIFLDGFTPCKPFVCPDAQIGCGPTQGASQATSISTLQQQYAGITPASVSLPTRLVRIRLCSGEEMYILLEMLPAIAGNFTVLQQIEVSAADQSFEFSANGSMPGVAFFDYVLGHLLEAGVLLDGYEPCVNDQPCDPTPPDCALGMEQAQQAAITALQQAFLTANGGSFTYPTHLYRLRLCSGQEFYVFKEELSIIPGNYIFLQDFTVNNPLPLGSQLFEMTVMINGVQDVVHQNLLKLLDYRRGVGGFLKIVGRYEPCGDISECSPSAPSCTPEEQAAQNFSLQALLANMPEYGIGTLPLPARLLLVRLCDGRELYLLEQELHLLTGSLSYLQDITVTGWGQSFTIVMDVTGATHTITFEQLLLQRADINFTIDGYGCTAFTTTQELSCIYTIDQVNFAVALDPNNPNPRAIITWDKVVYRNCGGGPELILTQPESMYIDYPYYRGSAPSTYQACEEIRSEYDVTVVWDEDGVPYFHPPYNGNPQVPYEVDIQQPINCTDEVTINQMVCPPLCGPGFDHPDPDGDGCPDEPEIGTDLNQLASAFHQAATNGSGSLFLPNNFNNVRFSDGSTRVVLDNELSLIDDCIDIVSTVPIGGGLEEYFHVELPTGGGSATLQNVLDLRAEGLTMEVTAPTATDVPPGSNPNTDILTPAVPEFTFFIYDHLGNTRIMYHNEMYDCEPFHTYYVLEHVLDYYPYGKTLREYVLDRERFETTYHERDEESGLDYRGARFYDGEIGRFLSVDPLAMEYAGWSTYNYVLGNPVRLVDPTGKSAQSPIFDENGNFLATDSEGFKGNIVIMNKHEYNIVSDNGKKTLDNKQVQKWTNGSCCAQTLDNYMAKDFDLSSKKDNDFLSNLFTNLLKEAKKEGLISYDTEKLLLGRVGVDNDTESPRKDAASHTTEGSKDNINVLVKPGKNGGKFSLLYLGNAANAVHILGVHEPLHRKYPARGNGKNGHGGMYDEIYNTREYRQSMDNMTPDAKVPIVEWEKH